MEKKPKSITRKNSPRFQIPVFAEEAKAIKDQAKAAGLSVSAYFRNLALGYEIRSALDQDNISQLAKINADQGRLGGLLKMWLTNHEKLKGHDSDQLRITILGALDRIIENQEAMFDIVKQVAKWRG